ncbi:MAG TPA: peptidoglycan DD-metalloendopeptidase family protein [Nocardioidaceae bacterium]|nr:peptidoglycan DD-metalloendopeptidase family protein [Nocardioidaceae bacterium]
MVKCLPRDRRARKRLAAFTAVLGLLAPILSLQAVAAAGADPDQLRDQKAEVSESLEHARGDLGHSSARLVRTVKALQAAEARLSSAREKLDQARAELAVAVERDRRMQAKLRAAVQRLQEARAKLAKGKAEVEQQRDEVAAWAASTFQSSDNDMLGLRVLLSAESTESLSTQMGAIDSINAKNADRFDRLQATEVLLKVDEDEVEAAKDEVARRRAIAAKNLETKQALEARAQEARDVVASLVSKRAAAKQAAERAKAADRRQIAELESERSRIEAQLQKIAERRAAERRRQQAAARAAAQAAAEADARAEEPAEPSRSSSGGRSPDLGSGGFLSYPIDSYITSPYGMRFHPILKVNKLHDGTDFGAGCGTPIRAAADGRVLQAYYNGGYGNRLIIDHGVQRGVSLSTSYNHLSGYATSVGAQVQRGEVIGYVGTTGYSTGCHLHFMVYENGVTTDPMGWL